MTAERMHLKETKEIDLIDLIIEILVHWRGLIIAALIGGLVLGGYSIYSSIKENKAAKVAAAAVEEERTKVLSDQEYLEQEQEKTENKIAQLESILTEKEKTAVNQLLTYREKLKKQERYVADSVIMNADALNMPTGVVSIHIVSGQVSITALEDIYEGILTSVEMYDYLKNNLGYGSEINELVKLNGFENNNDNNIIDENKVNVGIKTDLITESDTDRILMFSFLALTEEDCEALEDAFIDFLMFKFSGYQKSLGNHQVIVVDKSVTTIYNTLVSSKQNEIKDYVASLKVLIANNYDSLSDSGKEYYNLLVKQKDNESQIAEKIERAEVATVTIPPILVDKKKLLIGLAGGFFMYAFVLCLIYIFSREIKDSDDFSITFGVNQLGKIYRESKSVKYATRLDKAIYLLKRRGRKKVPYDEAVSIVATNSSLTASKDGIKKLGIITADKEDIINKKVTEALKAEGVEGIVLSEPLYNNVEMSQLKNIDAALIIAKPGVSRYDDLRDIIDVLDNQKVKILGGIMA